jgi:hypothetical protein
MLCKAFIVFLCVSNAYLSFYELFFSQFKCLIWRCSLFQAGISVGDMILQVNKDQILGQNYDNVSFCLPLAHWTFYICL